VAQLCAAITAHIVGAGCILPLPQTADDVVCLVALVPTHPPNRPSTHPPTGLSASPLTLLPAPTACCRSPLSFKAAKETFADGGGIDNTAITPLLRRRVAHIVAGVATITPPTTNASDWAVSE
jgi:hypothetical protein